MPPPGMLKHMSDDDENYKYVLRAMAIASHIANCESDEQVRRAATMWGLKQTVADFPDALVSHQRFFIDAIDVEDLPVDPVQPLSLSASRGHSASALFCTLFLFSDCLVIVKRPRPAVNGRACSGLDDIESLVSLMGSSATASVTSSPSKLKSQLKKGVLSFKGCLMLDEFTGCDLGPDGLALHFEQTPSATNSTSEKWMNRALRHYVITPTAGSKSTPKAEKDRFLDHLWRIQAQYRGERLSEASSNATLLRTEYLTLTEKADVDPHRSTSSAGLLLFSSVHQRRDYDSLPSKKRHVLHFDLTGASNRIDFTDEGNPQAISRITPCLDGTYVATTEYRIPSRSTSTVGGVSLPLALMRVIESINEVGIFDFPPSIPGYRPAQPKTFIPARVRSPSLWGSTGLSRNGTIGSILSNSSAGGTSPHKRSGTIRSAVSVAESKMSSMFSQGISTPATSIYSREGSSSPVLISRDPSHEEVNGGRSRIHSPSPAHPALPHLDQPTSMSRSSSASSVQHSRNFPSYGSISMILEDEKEAVEEIRAPQQGMSKTQSLDQIRRGLLSCMLTLLTDSL
jgi:hypothetical protein